jgi:Acetyltransferase (GNAT) domain
MPIKIIDPITDPRWDKFVESHPFGWVCHLSGWKQVLEKSFKHMKGYYFVLVDENDNIKAGLPIYEVKSWLTGNRLVSIPFATLCDPLISKSEEMAILVEAVFEYFKDAKYSYVEIRTLAATSLIKNIGLKKVALYKYHYLSLENELEQIKSSFPSKTRYNIRRSMKSGLTVRKAENELDLLNFYKLYCKTRKRLSLPSQPYRYLLNLYNFISLAEKGTLLLGEKSGHLVVGGIFLKFKKRFSDEFRAWGRKYNELRPNYYLYWEAIQLAHSEGYEKFDFGRTSKHNTGLMDFKGCWGTQVRDLPQYFWPENIARKKSEREKSFGYMLVSNVSKRLPGKAYDILGKFCYHHLG